MQIGTELTAFLSSPVMIIVGTCDAAARPDIGRAVGARVEGEAGIVELVLSAWQWPRAVANVRAGSRAAVTFSRPSDYVSYQVKGRAALRESDTHALALAARYSEDISAVLVALGLQKGVLASWFSNREAVVVRLEVDAIYVQTPGAKAGQALAARSG
jgi:Pyridoxamine 5'-phosphate oxidase